MLSTQEIFETNHNMNIRETIIQNFHETVDATGSVRSEELTDETVLLNSGLDSLGFAILVTRLEEAFGKDPFTLMEEPFYPQTFGEFVEIYEKYVHLP